MSTETTASRSAESSPDEEGAVSEGVTRNAAFSFATQMTTAAITGVLTLYLGRALSPDGYGEFAFALGVGTLIFFVVEAGPQASTARFVAEVRGSYPRARAVIGKGLSLTLLMATTLSILLFALAGPLTSAFNIEGAAWPLRWMAIALLGQSTMMLLVNCLVALQRISINLRIVAAESVLELLASIALVVAGAGAAGAAFGRAFAYIAGAGIALVLIVRAIGRIPLRGGASDAGIVRTRAIAQYAGALVIVGGLFKLFAEIDVLLIAATIGGGTAVGLFELPMKLAWFLQQPFGAVAAAIAPRMARTDGAEPDTDLFIRALRYMLMFQGMFIAPLLVWSEPIVRLILGSEYAESAGVLRALTPFIAFAGPAVLVTLAVNYLGQAKLRIPLAAAALAANTVIDIVLLPRIGIVAAAIGTDVAYAIWVPGHFILMRRLIDLPLRPFALAFVRSAVAVAVTSGLLLLLGTGTVALPVLLLGSVASVPVYVAVLRLVRELNDEDIALARGALGQRFARLRPTD